MPKSQLNGYRLLKDRTQGSSKKVEGGASTSTKLKTKEENRWEMEIEDGGQGEPI